MPKFKFPDENDLTIIVECFIINLFSKCKGEIKMKFSFEIKIKATAAEVWEYYANFEKWYVWESDLENISLDGDGKFVTGNTGVMKLQGMPEMVFSLVAVAENKGFIDVTSTPIGDVSFGHFIIPQDDGVSIRHEVSLDNEDPANLGMLKGIFNDVPASMIALKKAVEK